MGNKKDITIIEDQLEDALHDCKLDSMVTVDEIKRWMTDLDFNDKKTPIYMITGLVDNDLLEQPELLEQLINAIIELYHVMPLPSLDGATFHEVLDKRTNQNIPTQINMHETTIPPRDWFKPYYEAMQLMHQQQFSNACKKFDETFQQLLESKTTDSDIYRLYCNAGLAYLLSGQPYMGTGCISIATNLNPKYTFAKQQLQKIEQGDFNKLVELALMMKMTKNMENMQKYEQKKDHLNLDKVMNWSEKKILKKLSSYGITVDKKEFIRTAQTVNNAEDIAEKLFYPKVSVTPENEDFFWIAACALWEKYCPGEQSITGFRTTIHNAYTFISKKDLANRDDTTLTNKEINQLRKHLKEIQNYVFSKKKDLIPEWGHMLDVDNSAYELREFLTDLLFIPTVKDKVLSIVQQLISNDPDADWYYINIIDQIQQDRTKGRKLYETIQKKYPYYCYIASDIGLYYVDKNDYDAAETYFLDALDIIDKRAEENKYSIDSTFSTIYEDYTVVLDHLEHLYSKKKPDVKQKKWLKEKRKQIEKKKKQLSYSPQIEKMDKALSDQLYQDEIEKAENSYPMQYYEFLSQFNINFETDKSVKVSETYLPISGQSMIENTVANKKNTKRTRKHKKIGRNDPCPCGSGKKYKKCCGSITKK